MMKTNKIKIRIINFLFRLYLRLKNPLDIIKQDYRDLKYAIKKQAKTFIRWLKKAPKRIYTFIDKGEPSWLSLFGGIRFTIPIKSIYKRRQKRKYLLSFLPDYYNYNYSMIFLHTSALPENSDAISELQKLKILMQNHGFVKNAKITSDEDSFKSNYSHKKYGTIDIFIYIDDFCDIEYIDVVKQEPVIVGMCAKVLEELNSN